VETTKCKVVYGLQPYMVKISPVFLQYQLCTSVIAMIWGGLVICMGLMATLVDRV